MTSLWNFQSQISTSGYFFDKQLAKRLESDIYLEQYGYKFYSQNDEDGIIAEIFHRIGTKSKRFIEFGVENGLESNGHLLLHYGWQGLWLEGSEQKFRSLKRRFQPVIRSGQLTALRRFITRDNVNDLFVEAGFTGEIDLLSIDIDGNDYHVWEAIDVVSPRSVVIEYNAKFPPDCESYPPETPNEKEEREEKEVLKAKGFREENTCMTNRYVL